MTTKKPICKHSYLVPLEVRFGKKATTNGPKGYTQIMDWSSNIMGAHLARVISYYCPNCKKEIVAPERKD